MLNMSPEAQSANSASWKAVEAEVQRYRDGREWKMWKAMARQFLTRSFELGLDRYFRAGQSINHFVFSTLGCHGLRDEPRVTVELHPGTHEMRIAYGRGNLWFGPAELEYTLPFDEGMKTFQRFLNSSGPPLQPRRFPKSSTASLLLSFLPRGKEDRRSVKAKFTLFGSRLGNGGRRSPLIRYYRGRSDCRCRDRMSRERAEFL